MLKTYTTKDKSFVETSDLTGQGITLCVRPTADEKSHLCSKLNIDSDMLSDALDIYETPRTEEYNGVTYFYTRYCRPENPEIATEPITLILTPKHLVIVFREKSTFQSELLGKIDCDAALRTRMIFTIMAQINASYRTYLLKVSRDVMSVRSRLNKNDIDNKDFVNFIDMEEDLGEIIGALKSYDQVLQVILRGKLIKMFEEDTDLAEDVDLGIKELLTLAESRKSTIASTREAYSTIMANSLNKTFKKLTSISIFLTIPSVTAGLYGMNLALPLAHNPLAFWYILGIVMALTAFVVVLFKKLKWL
jgi:magnesium transporter